jgi:predicted transcriptional regulator
MNIDVDSRLAARLADQARDQGFASTAAFVESVLREVANRPKSHEIDRMLDEAEADVRAGRVMSYEDSLADLRSRLAQPIAPAGSTR